MATLVFSGGLNERDIALVQPEECIEGYNCELGFGQTSFRPRKPFDLMGTATNAGSIQGIMQMINNSGTETTLVQSDDVVYKWDGADVFSSMGTVDASSQLRATYWSLDQVLIITDLKKATAVQSWNGTALSTFVTGIEPTNFFAKYAIVHLGRVWFFNITAGTATPHLIAASAFENANSLDTTTIRGGAGTSTEAFYMTSPDLLPINGVAVFGGNIIFSTEGGRLWKISGTDASDFAITSYYTGSAAVGVETMALTGNDVVYMKQNGVVESLIDTDRSGDVATNDLSKWVTSTMSGATTATAITVYDQSRQKIYFFCGSNRLMVYFKDLANSGLSPWMKYKTDHASSFSTSAATYIREAGGSATSDYYVYFGDSTGGIYRLDGTGTGDNGDTAIESTRKTGFIERTTTEEGQQVYVKRDRIRGRVFYRRISSTTLIMQFEWADDFGVNQNNIALEGPTTSDAAAFFNDAAYFGGSFYFNTGFALSYRNATKGFSAIGRGPGVNVLTSITTKQDFDVLKIEI